MPEDEAGFFNTGLLMLAVAFATLNNTRHELGQPLQFGCHLMI
jgi:hypothetical protein